jgi:hypothetical protein
MRSRFPSMVRRGILCVLEQTAPVPYGTQ